MQNRHKILTVCTVTIGIILLMGTVSNGYALSDPSVRKIAVVQTSNLDRIIPSVNEGVFIFVFEACAGNKSFVAPEVIVSSDSQVKSVKLAKMLGTNTCQTSSTKLIAKDPSSIKGQIIEKGGMSPIIKNLEGIINYVKVELQNEKDNLKSLISQSPTPTDFKKKVQESTDKIVQWRQALNDARQEYFRNLYLIHK